MKLAAKALIRDDQGKILVLYRSQSHPHLAHDIDLPGGEIDYGEGVEEGLVREISEETGISLTLDKSQLRHSWQPLPGYENYIYEVSHGEPASVKISWEHEAYEWMDEADFVNHPAVCGFMHEAQSWLKG